MLKKDGHIVIRVKDIFQVGGYLLFAFVYGYLDQLFRRDIVSNGPELWDYLINLFM